MIFYLESYCMCVFLSVFAITFMNESMKEDARNEPMLAQKFLNFFFCLLSLGSLAIIKAKVWKMQHLCLPHVS